MADVKVEINKECVSRILKSAEMLAICTNEARKQSGKGQRINPFIGFDRAKAIVGGKSK